MNPSSLGTMLGSLCGIAVFLLLIALYVSIRYRISQHRWLYARGFDAGLYFFKQSRKQGISLLSFSQKPKPRDPYDRGRADAIRNCIEKEKGIIHER